MGVIAYDNIRVGHNCGAYKTGEWRNEQKEIKIKTHGRKAISYFRYGPHTIRDLVLNGSTSISHIGRTVRDFFILKQTTVIME